VSLLRPHHPNNNALFPNRCTLESYDFGAPDDTEWYVEKITTHRWVGCSIEFEVKWSLGDTTWEPLTNCNDLAALDLYMSLMGLHDWRGLRRCVEGSKEEGLDPFKVSWDSAHVSLQLSQVWSPTTVYDTLQS
jgi:hypothetical protein